jgi:hypothetical protein
MDDIISLYSRASVHAWRALNRNWILLPLSFLCVFAMGISMFLGSFVGDLRAELIKIFGVFIASAYLTWISKILRGGRLEWGDIRSMELSILGVCALAYLLTDSVLHLTVGLQDAIGIPFGLVAAAALGLSLSPLPEISCQRNYDVVQTFRATIGFVRASWWRWFPPLIVPLIVFFVLGNPFRGSTSSMGNLTALAGYFAWDVIFPGTSMGCFFAVFVSRILSLSPLPEMVIPLLSGIATLGVVNFFVLFRGYLFQKIEAPRLGDGEVITLH